MYLGEIPFLVLVGLLLTLAEIEFCSLMARDGFRPTLVFGLGMMWLFLLDMQFPAWQLLRPGLALVLLGSVAWQLFHRQGSAVADWALTVTGGLYLGMCGAALVGLRGLDDDGLFYLHRHLHSLFYRHLHLYCLFDHLWLAPSQDCARCSQGAQAQEIAPIQLFLIHHPSSFWGFAVNVINWHLCGFPHVYQAHRSPIPTGMVACAYLHRSLTHCRSSTHCLEFCTTSSLIAECFRGQSQSFPTISRRSRRYPG